MKKVVACFFIICCLAGMVNVSAIVPDYTNAYNTQVQTEGFNNVADYQAEMLKALGLFLGTDKGFELYRNLSRAEAAVLIVRFMGEEKNALAPKNDHPFTDVPDWAGPYVGWLYQNKITNGVSATLYGSTRFVTYWQFATLLSRAATGADDFLGTWIGTEEEQRNIDRTDYVPPDNETSFQRGDAVSLLTRFMSVYYTKDIKPADPLITVAQFLERKGVFTVEQFVSSTINVYPIDYPFTENDGLIASILGIRFSESTLTGLMGKTTATAQPYFYAWKLIDSDIVLYRMDCLTLHETEVGRVPSPTDGFSLINLYASIDGIDYLGLSLANDSGGSLLCADDDGMSVVAEGKLFGADYNFVNDGKIVVMDNTVFVITKDGVISRELTYGTEIVGVDYGGTAVLYHEEDGFGVIEGVTLTDWTVTDTYRVDLSDPRINLDLPIIAFRPSKDGSLGSVFYGEAGLFTGMDGLFVRVTDRPVLDIGGLRVGAVGAWVILSHEPGSRAGSTIYQYDGPILTGKDGYIEYERLGHDPPHGIEIDSIRGADSMVFFFSRHPVGMEKHDVYAYYPYYNWEEGHMGIGVMSFTPGRPEISFAEHDEQWYIKQEQERLNALGYNPYVY